MGQVAAEPMSSNAAAVAGAIEWAYQQLKGATPPRRESWLWPLAVSSNETAAWRDPRTAANHAGLYNSNVGNVTTLGSGVDWYYNPAVTNGLKFTSYADLGAGALGMMKVLQRVGALAAADNADSGAFQAALNTYLGGTYPSMAGLIAHLSSTTPTPWGGSPTVSPAVASRGRDLAIGVGIVALAGALSFAWHELSPTPRRRTRRAYG